MALFAPFFPLFVVMINAPFEALEPYNAAAAGPFNTVTDSISSGLISLPRLPKSTLERSLDPPTLLVLSIGVPSTTISAWLFPAIEEPPRKTTRDELPGEFDVEVIFTPATLPAKELIALELRPSVNSSLLIVGAE